MKIEIIVLLLILFVVLYLQFSKFNGSIYKQPKVYESLITPDEANYILKKSNFQASTTVGGFDKSIRDSNTLWIPKNDPVVKNIYDRLSKKFNFNPKNAEQLQVVKYNPGGFYKEHHDSCCDNTDVCNTFKKDWGQRVLTILIYLNDDFEEGSTYFPNLKLNLKAPKYGGVVFYPDNCNPDSLHTGTPVKTGTKYICNIWIREREV